MLAQLGANRVWMAVVSSGRPENVRPMAEKIGAATWYVPEEQMDEYADQGVVVRPGSATGVTPVRNRILDTAFGPLCPDTIAVMLDDDLKWAAFASNGKAEHVPPRVAITNMVRRLKESDFHLAGASPTNNPYFTRQSQSIHLFIRSGVLAVKPTPLRFDENLKVKEDYDYTIQHYLEYGGVLRCDDLLFDFQQRTNKGGYTDSRSLEREEAAVQYLMSKWGKLVKRHPRRPGEVTLSLPRPKREVLT